MKELAIALTLGLSLSHPNAFGTAWYLLALACISLGIYLGLFRGHAAIRWLIPDTGRTAWIIWLIAFGPLCLLSLLSVAVFKLPPSRAEVIELFFGGLALAAGLQHLKPKGSTLLYGLGLAAAAGLLLSAYEFFVLHQPRVGVMFHPINFAISCGCTLLILILHNIIKIRNSWITNIAIIAAAIALLGSGSRGPMISLVICLGLALLIRPTHQDNAPRIRMSPTLLLSVTLFAGALTLVFMDRFGTDIELGAESSIGKRWQLILITLEQMRETPWMGIGTDQAGRFFATFPGSIASLDHAHVTMLNLGLELGIPGVIAWLWAFIVLAWTFLPWRRQNQPTSAMIGFAACCYFFLCALTQDILSHAYTRQYLAFMMTLLLTLTLLPADRSQNA